MVRGQMVYVPPFWAHRSVNTGREPLVSFCVYPAEAGHNYGDIAGEGFPQRVFRRGGQPVTDDFYDLCDELGLMVMQEWPTAWNSHKEQPYGVLEETVRLNTLRLRNRPSWVMTTGGNESSDPFGPAIDMMGRLAIELDGTRPFHRGEPWGGSRHAYPT
jgi:hypothetical protein